VRFIAFSNADRFLTVINSDSSVQTWNILSGNELISFETNNNEIRFFDILFDQFLVTNGSERHLNFWSILSGELRLTINTDDQPIDHAFSSDGLFQAILLKNHTISVLSGGMNTITQGLTITDICFESHPNAMNFVTNTHILLLSCDDLTLEVYDVSTGDRILEAEGTDYTPIVTKGTSALLIPGNYSDGAMTFINIEDSAMTPIELAHDEGFTAIVDISDDGSIAFVRSFYEDEDSSFPMVNAYNTATGDLILFLGRTVDAILSRTERYIATITEDHTVIIFSLK
jgi:WD40 repeat protein